MCDGRTIVTGKALSRYACTSRSSQAILSLEYCQCGLRRGVDSSTGIVVLAGDDGTKRYLHNMIKL